jgi:hypothetical protein
MMVRVFLLVATMFAATSVAETFDKVGVKWCDQMLAQYELCLSGVTYKKCEFVAQRDKLSATYQQPGPAGAYRGPRTYSTPAARCLAEIQDLIAEMRANVTVIKIAAKDKETACLGIRSIIINNSKSFCGK